MSTYSLDSLDKGSNARAKFITRPEDDFAPQIARDNSEDREDKMEERDDYSDKDEKFNESSSFVKITETRKRELVKFFGNSIIASKEFCSRVKKLPTIVGKGAYFRAGRPVQKKFNVPRRSLSSSSSSLSSTEFRHGTASLLAKKRPGDVTEFMKDDKKPGNVKPDFFVVDNHKKSVSYLQLYRKRFGGDISQCIDPPLGLSICVDGSDQQPTQEINCNVDLLGVSRDENNEVDFHPRGSQLDCFTMNETLACGNGTREDNSIEFFHDDDEPKNPKRRVFYEPYDIEDYKNFSLPRPDRSLGPDKKEMESKGEWLMRRRTYGDSVSALNRQRILLRAEKLKHSRRLDSQKVPLHSTLTNLKHPGPASKIDDSLEQIEIITRARSFSSSREQKGIKQRERAAKMTEKLLNVSKKEPTLFLHKRKSKIFNSTRVDDNFYETSSDTFDDDSMHLENLRNRHLEEKKTIDRLLKRGLSAR